MTIERDSRHVAAALRHSPDVPRTDDGWVKVSNLLRHTGLRRGDLDAVLAASGRYELDQHGLRIRAKYGHSVEVDLGAPCVPPDALFHGTRWAVVGTVLREGLSPMARQRVHLHTDPEVARRRGDALLVVSAALVHAAGHHFWDVGNGVWLADAVPAEFVRRWDR